MKAVLQNLKTGRISLGDIPQPVTRPGRVLVRNICSLVSAGTEKSVMEFSKANYLMKARQRPDLFRKVLTRAKNEGFWQTYQVVSHLIDQPIQLGYSSAGVVIEVGSDVTDIQVGQRVACAGLFVATHAEVVSVPRNLLALIPDGVSFEEASFVTLGAIALQGVRLADLALSEHVVVYGLGLVGMVSAQLAIAAGCHVIGIDIDPSKVELARTFGCTGVVAASGFERAILEATGGYGADKVLLCAATTSNEPIERVPAFTRQKGTLVVVGDVRMDVPRRAYFDKEIDIRISRSYGPGRYDLSYEEGGIDYPYAYVRWTENRNLVAVLDLVARQRIAPSRLITHRLGMHDATRAYEIIEGTVPEPYLGIVIRYADDEPTTDIARSVSFPAAAAAAHDVGIGVIGAGNFAKAFLLPAFAAQAQATIRSVCTASGVSAVAVATKYRAAQATPDPDDVLRDPSVRLALIATRHDTHAAYVLRALAANKAVYVEKPLALTLAELEAIRDQYDTLVQAGARPFLMVGFNRRFSPLAQSLKQVFARRAEPLSVIYRVNAGSVPRSEWVHDPAIGGGRVIGECSHFIDFVTFLTDALPVRVASTACRLGGRLSDDTVTITLEMSDGSLGTIHYFANGHTAMPKERIEVFSGGVCAALSNFKRLTVYGASVPGRQRYLNQVKGFAQEAKAVVSAVARDAPAPIPFDQLYAVSRASVLAVQAVAAGTTLVV
jgi:predicted dehydrogenase/threonine dehydrogenase-like Zn-dependent dehydrogenase